MRSIPAPAPLVVGVLADAAHAEAYDVDHAVKAVVAALRRIAPHTPVRLITTAELYSRVNNAQLESFPIDVTSSDVLDAVADRSSWHEIAQVCRCAALVLWLESKDDAPSETRENVWRWRTRSFSAPAVSTHSILHAPELGPIVSSCDLIAGAEFSRGLEMPPHRKISDWLADVKELDQFNAEAIMLPTQSAQDPDLDDCFSAADRLSRKHQDILRLQMRLVFGVGAAAAILLQLMGAMWSNLPMADLYALLFMAFGSGYFWLRQRTRADRYADYRVLAECLRVQRHWNDAGLPDCAADHILYRHQRRLGWVALALRAHTYSRHIETKGMDTSQSWLRPQLAYHQESARRHTRLSLANRWAVNTCYGIALVLTFVLFLQPSGSLAAPLANGLSHSLGAITSLGTLLLIYSGMSGYGERVAASARLTDAFSLALAALEAGLPETERMELLRDLGWEVIVETSEWIYVQGPS